MKLTRRQLNNLVLEALNLQEQFLTAANSPGSYVSNRTPPMIPLEVDGVEIDSINIAADGSITYEEPGSNVTEIADATMKTKLINLIDNNRSDFSFTPETSSSSTAPVTPTTQQPGQTRQSASRSNAARSWNQYVSKTNSTAGGDLGTKVRDGWQDVCEKDESLGDGSFKSWVAWYNTSRKDAALMATAGKRSGQHLSPEEVLKLYLGLVLMTPTLEGIKVPPGEIDQEALDRVSKELGTEHDNATTEDEKKKIKDRIATFGKNIKSKFPKLEFRSPIVVKKQDDKSGEGETRQAAKKNMTVDEAERTAQNYVAQQSNPALFAVGIGKDKSDATNKARQNFMKKQGKSEMTMTNTRSVKTYTTSDGTVVVVLEAGEENLQETFSRGELYRRRYYGRY